MSWALRLSRFIHGVPRLGQRSRRCRTPAGRGRIAAQRFADSFVETAIAAFLNFARALAPLPDASAHGASHA